MRSLLDHVRSTPLIPPPTATTSCREGCLLFSVSLVAVFSIYGRVDNQMLRAPLIFFVTSAVGIFCSCAIHNPHTGGCSGPYSYRVPETHPKPPYISKIMCVPAGVHESMVYSWYIRVPVSDTSNIQHQHPTKPCMISRRTFDRKSSAYYMASFFFLLSRATSYCFYKLRCSYDSVPLPAVYQVLE